jgi:LPXTG-motif cell wall-anchored protein
MRRIAVLIPLAVMVMGMASCPSLVDDMHQQKRMEWYEANPGKELTQMEDWALRQSAIADLGRQTQTAIGAGGQIATGFGTGNYMLVVTGILSLFGIGTGLYVRHRRKR